MALLLFVLWAAYASSLRAHVHRLPPFQHASAPLVARETFKPAPYKRPLPHGLSALLLPTAGPPHRDTGPSSPPGPVEVWCGLRSVGVRVDRLRLRHWSDPRLFRLSSCGVSAATRRYLYFHRGLKECGTSEKVVGGQLVYTFTLTYSAPHQGPVLRAPPLNMILTCHYNRFHYSYRVGFLPQSAPSTFLMRMRSQSSFSLSVCNSRWEVLPPEHHFLLGESVYFMAQSGAVGAGEQLYVDSCHVTGSNDPTATPRLDIIANFGCMVDSLRTDSSSRFDSRGPSELRFSVDSLLFRPEGQMLFLHCSMSVGLQPSPSSKSCTFNKASGRWLELEASHSLCYCCDSVCEDKSGADSSTVSSAAWYLSQPTEQLYHHTVSMKSGLGLDKELLQETVSLKKGDADLDNSIKKNLDQGHVSLKSGRPDLMKDSVGLKVTGPDLAELHSQQKNTETQQQHVKAFFQSTFLSPRTAQNTEKQSHIHKTLFQSVLTKPRATQNTETQPPEDKTLFQSGLLNPRAAQNTETQSQDEKTLFRSAHTNPTTAQNMETQLQDDKTLFRSGLLNPRTAQNTETQSQEDKTLFQSSLMNPSSTQNPETQAQIDKTLFESALTNPTAAQNMETQPQDNKKLLQSVLMNPGATLNVETQPQDDKTLFKSGLLNPRATQNMETQPQDDRTLFKSGLLNPRATQNMETQPQDDRTLFKSALTNPTAAQNTETQQQIEKTLFKSAHIADQSQNVTTAADDTSR